jgi:hypothetical protein
MESMAAVALLLPLSAGDITDLNSGQIVRGWGKVERQFWSMDSLSVVFVFLPELHSKLNFFSLSLEKSFVVFLWLSSFLPTGFCKATKK